MSVILWLNLAERSFAVCRVLIFFKLCTLIFGENVNFRFEKESKYISNYPIDFKQFITLVRYGDITRKQLSTNQKICPLCSGE